MLSDYPFDRLNESTRLNDSRLNDSLNGSRSKKKRTIEDYEFIINENSRLKTSDLGKGSYGTVKKVKDKLNGKVYAMKIMNKKGIFEYSSKENLKREITIQREIVHPNIVRLYTYFEDSENVYLVLEYAENGSLFHYLRRKKKFVENEAFVYFFQTCLGIDYLHKRNVIHRDLKPENLLLDSDGNIKLCDFGWSADTSSKRQTFCGTVDYMAPEMIKNQSHDHRLDIWCLGILLYEMLHGYAPYKGRNDQEKCRNISMNMPLDFDKSLSTEVVDLIKKILQPAPINRISMYELFNHPWMKKAGKAYNIDVMSYVQQQDEQIRELQKNGTLILDKTDKSSSETLLNKELAKPAKIITVVDNSPPIKLAQSSTPYSNKSSYNGSTQGSENNSIGPDYLSQSAKLNYTGQDYRYETPQKALSSKVESLQSKKFNSEGEQPLMYKSAYTSVSDTKIKNNSIDLQTQLYIHNQALRQNDIDLYLNKSNIQRQKTTQLEKAFQKEYASQNSPDRFKYVKSSSLYENSPFGGNKVHINGVGKLNALYEDDDDFMNGPRASRISKRNAAVDSLNHRDVKEKKEPSFFEGLLAGFTCLSRDTPKK